MNPAVLAVPLERWSQLMCGMDEGHTQARGGPCASEGRLRPSEGLGGRTTHRRRLGSCHQPTVWRSDRLASEARAKATS